MSWWAPRRRTWRRWWPSTPERDGRAREATLRCRRATPVQPGSLDALGRTRRIHAVLNCAHCIADPRRASALRATTANVPLGLWRSSRAESRAATPRALPALFNPRVIRPRRARVAPKPVRPSRLQRYPSLLCARLAPRRALPYRACRASASARAMAAEAPGSGVDGEVLARPAATLRAALLCPLCKARPARALVAGLAVTLACATRCMPLPGAPCV